MDFYIPVKPMDVFQFIVDMVKGTGLSSSFVISGNEDRLALKITKLGTSKFKFDIEPYEDGTRCSLVEEDISFMHRAFKTKIRAAFSSKIEEYGGKLL
jgi:hypothetical protein